MQGMRCTLHELKYIKHFISEFLLGDSIEGLNLVIFWYQKKINDKAGNPIFSIFVYYKHLVIIGHNDRFSHALSVRKYEEHNLDSLIENQWVHKN